MPGFVVITAGLAFVTRGTVGALIAWLGYLIGVEAVLGQRVRELQPGLLLGNFIAFVSNLGSRRWDSLPLKRQTINLVAKCRRPSEKFICWSWCRRRPNFQGGDHSIRGNV